MFIAPNSSKSELASLAKMDANVSAGEFAQTIDRSMFAVDESLKAPENVRLTYTRKRTIRRVHAMSVLIGSLCSHLSGRADAGEQVNEPTWQRWLDESFAAMSRWRIRAPLDVGLMMRFAITALKTKKRFRENDWTPEDRAVSALIDAARRHDYWAGSSWTLDVTGIDAMVKAREHRVFTQCCHDIRELGLDARWVEAVGGIMALRGNSIPEQAYKIAIDSGVFRGTGARLLSDAMKAALPMAADSIGEYTSARVRSVGDLATRIRDHEGARSDIPSPLDLVLNRTGNEKNNRPRTSFECDDLYQQHARQLAAVLRDFIMTDYAERWESSSQEDISRDCEQACEQVMRACFGTADLYIGDALRGQLEEAAAKRYADSLFDDAPENGINIGPTLG